jgi:thiamine monophosphate kinase
MGHGGEAEPVLRSSAFPGWFVFATSFMGKSAFGAAALRAAVGVRPLCAPVDHLARSREVELGAAENAAQLA